MRLKILAATALLFPALALAQGGGLQICDSTGKCVLGTTGQPVTADGRPAAPAAPAKPIVFAAPDATAPGAAVQLSPAPAEPATPVAETLPAAVVQAPVVAAPEPPPAPPLAEAPVVAPEVATPAPAYASQSMTVPTPSGEVVVVTEASGPATSALSASRFPASGLPSKGMTRSAVSRQFGAPQIRHAAVGGGSPRQPPITRWDYAGFSVFFEYDHVVDAVERGNPAPIAVRDGLAGGPQ